MNIVIIDDESVICSGLQKIIENSQNDWQVCEVYTDAQEALEFCDWDSVDLLLSDINMPNIDGLTLVDTLKKRGHDVQVIFISGYTEFKYAKKALQQKAIDYIIKPVSVKTLKEAIQKSEDIMMRKKKMLRDEQFIKSNIETITKSFIFDMLFETKRLSKREIEDGLKYCSLKDRSFSLISFMLKDALRINNIIDSFKENTFRTFLYTSKSEYNVIVVCEEKNKRTHVDTIIDEINSCCPNLSIGQIKHTDNILKLSEINYEMMSHHKEDLFLPRKLNNGGFQSSDDNNYEDEYSTHVISAIEYIKEHYSKKISLSSLSEELYVHPTYLSNLFKKQTGINIVDFINNYRIEVAKDLLKDSRNKIYWVAERVGFVNQRYFSQKFKKITGYTPVEYKQKIFFGH